MVPTSQQHDVVELTLPKHRLERFGVAEVKFGVGPLRSKAGERVVVGVDTHVPQLPTFGPCADQFDVATLATSDIQHVALALPEQLSHDGIVASEQVLEERFVKTCAPRRVFTVAAYLCLLKFDEIARKIVGCSFARCVDIHLAFGVFEMSDLGVREVTRVGAIDANLSTVAHHQVATAIPWRNSERSVAQRTIEFAFENFDQAVVEAVATRTALLRL